MRHATHIVTLAIGLSPLLASAAASAQERTVPLEETVRVLFADSPVFRTYAAQTSEAEGMLLRSSGAFDTIATAGLRADRTLLADPAGVPTNASFNELAGGVGLATTLRANVSAQITANTPLASNVTAAAMPDQPNVMASLTIPLLKLGSNSRLAAEERAAGLRASAAAALQEDQESELARDVAQSYWRWSGSYEQLEWARRLEALAADQLKDVDELISHSARAVSERLPFSAAAQNATATRAEAEQVIVNAEELLWRTLGLPAPPRGVARPVDVPLPPMAGLDAASLASRAHQEARGRALLVYLDRETAAEEARAQAASLSRRPDLNLTAQGAATRVEDYALATQSPLGYSTQFQVGYYGGLALSFAMPLQNRAARGDYQIASALEDERLLEARQRRNAIDAQIDALSTGLATVAHTYQERAAAAAQYQASYEAERAKFRAGGATGLDVIVAEQQYMTASLATVSDRIAYAVTLAAYLHEAGTLARAVRSRDPRAAVRLLAASPL